MPRWVKASIGVVAALVLIGVAMMALGHNPMQHFSGHVGMAG
jgi:hypothetical protein